MWTAKVKPGVWITRFSCAVLAALTTAGLLFLPIGPAGCSDKTCFSDQDAGCATILENQVDVTFVPGTTVADVDSLHAMIGATTLVAPVLATTYRIKLPEGWCYERGSKFYENQLAVVVAAPVLKLCASDGG